MSFKSRYISTSENKINPDPKKIILSDDAYAIVEQLEAIRARMQDTK